MLKCNFIINSYIMFSVNRLVNVTIHFIATNESIHNTISFQNRYIYSVANLIMIKAFLKTALSYRSIMFLLIKLHILTIVYKVSIVRFTKVCVWSKKAAVSQCTNIAEFDPSIKWVNCAWNMKNHYSYIFCLIKYAID